MHQRSLFRVRMNSWPPAPWIFCRLVFIHQVLYSPRCAYMHPPNHRVGIELEISFRSMGKVMHQTYFSGSSSGVSSFCPLYVHVFLLCRTLLHRFRPEVHLEQHAPGISTWCAMPKNISVSTTSQPKTPQSGCARGGDPMPSTLT